jgi:hypothetical protein
MLIVVCVGMHRAPTLLDRWKGLWRNPIVAVVALAGTVTLAIVAAMNANRAGPMLDKIVQPEPIKIVSVTWMTGPELGSAGYVIPAAALAGLSENEARTFVERPTDGFTDWLASNGAIAVGSVVWQVVIEGGLHTELVLVGLRPVLEGACTTPENGGNLIEVVPEELAGQPVFDTDIDAEEPVFVRVDGDSERMPAFTDTAMRLPKGERNPLLLRANSHGPHCKFRIELSYLADGHSQTKMLTAPGDRPFEVTGHATAYKWVYRPPIICGKVARISGEGWKPNSTTCS